MFLVYKGITSLERKYNLIRNNGNNSFNDLDDDNNANGKRDGYKISNSYEEGIRTNKFLGKFEIMHKNILKVLESKSILEIYWPD